jgi:multimeric flavodoxin WrbA
MKLSTGINGDTKRREFIMTKIVGLSGSPRKEGNTEILVKEALKAAKKQGAETEFISLAGKKIEPCQACYTCRSKDSKGICAIKDDLPPIFEKLKKADGVIIGSPVYFLSVTAQLKALFDRSLILRYGKGNVKRKPGLPGGPEFLLTDKVGSAIAVGRGSGQQLTILEILKWMLSQNMIVVGNRLGLGTNARGGKLRTVLRDRNGLSMARHTGLRVAEIVKEIKRSKS